MAIINQKIGEKAVQEQDINNIFKTLGNYNFHHLDMYLNSIRIYLIITVLHSLQQCSPVKPYLQLHQNIFSNVKNDLSQNLTFTYVG